MVEPIVAVLDDLIFGVKIQDAARRLGLGIRFVKSPETAWEAARATPRLIFLDLNIRVLNAIELAQRLKENPATRPIPIVAFVSHVQIDLRRQAQEAGCDEVLARSTFSTKVPDLISRYALPQSL